MKIASAQTDILKALMKNPRGVTVLHDSNYNPVAILVGGVVGYFIPADALWLDLAKVEAQSRYNDVIKVSTSSENELTVTAELVDSPSGLLRKFTDFAGNEIYALDASLKKFDLYPKFYQSNPRGPILVTEISAIDGEHNVGILMPVQPGAEE